MNKIIIIATVFVCNVITALAQKVGIGTNNPSNMLEVVSNVTTSSGAAMAGTNEGTIGAAIVGNSAAANTIAVIGSSTDGYGVRGFSLSNIGVAGLTGSGIALSASSSTGYALQIIGNLKFSGGNTNPSKGAVLTSDASGNATWKKSNVAFLGTGTIPSNFANGVFKKVEFANIDYDLQNNFLNYNGGVTPATSSTFTAPVAGVYHFSSHILFSKSAFGVSNYHFTNAEIKLVKNGSSIASFIGHPSETAFAASRVDLQIFGDFHLNANDKVWIEATQYSGGAEPPSSIGRFSGHLVVAD